MYKILIVEDDNGIANGISSQLKNWGHDSRIVVDFANVMKEFQEYEPHMVLLDIGLPFFNGYHWCGEIRKISKVPIMFISSTAENMNIVMAVNMGADDFIAKPFDVNVLVAKVGALLRRAYDFGESSNLMECRGAVLNTGDQSFKYNGENISLTKNEYRILYSLIENRGKIVSREKLMELLWNSDCFVDENTLTVNVNRLRKKLDNAGLEGFITTKFGQGYIIS
ncbi:MAG: response regulator transcription factor [Lachnospiraceae bacterium]|nr:response regulator transcription factor [Lachnospiraceae bacterium]